MSEARLFRACGQFLNRRRNGPLAPDNSAALKGLFYGGGTTLLTAQAIGSLVVTVSTFAVAMLVMYAVNATGTLRVSEDGELYGLDLHEHGISAYPEYVISSLGRPPGMAAATLAAQQPAVLSAKATMGHAFQKVGS